MTQTATDRRISLDQPERDMIKRRPTKTGAVAVVYFRGPRGRQYRPVRSQACLNADLALDAALKIRGKRYAHGAYPTKTEILTVDFIGRVVAVETV